MPKIIIQAPREGIARSPFVGFGDVRNLDIDSLFGIARLNNILVKKSSTTVVAQVNWIVRHPITTTKIYALDNAGTVYKSTDTGATWAVLAGSSSTNAHGNGLWIWKNYLFVARDALLDTCGDGTATGITAANWTLGWKTIDSDVLWHPMLTSKNDSKLFGGAGRFVYSLEELTTFAPGSAPTYTWTQQALDLPTAYRIKCIEELGNNLMLGTWQGTNIYDVRIADIFPWDRSAVSFGQPIVIPEYGVHAMKNVGNSLIILAGTTGVIYRSDGVNATIIGKLPIDLSGGKYIEYYPGALTYYKNKIFFGTGHTALTVGGAATTIGGMGVYSLETTSKGNILNLEHLSSALTDGSAAAVKYSALLPISDETLLVAWRSATTYGIDLTTEASFAYGTDYSGYFESPLYNVGSLLRQITPTEIEFNLARPLRTGEAIRLAYRTDLTATFKTIATHTFSTAGAVVSVNTIFDFPAMEQVQFRVSLNGSSTTTPELRGITIRF